MFSIKRIFFITFMLIIMLALPAYGSVFEEESWIAAFYYKKTLTPYERYMPFVNIRESNYMNTISPGAAIRTIEADFIIMSQLPLLSSIDKFSSDELTFEGVIAKVFASINDHQEYVSNIHQLAALTVFREEILEKNNIIKSFHPYEYYYRFYHFSVSQYEAVGVTLNPEYKLKPTKYSDKIGQLRNQYIDGVYNTPLEKLKNEVEDSIIAVNRINSMLPLKAKEYINYYSSPFVSAEITVLDDESKNMLGPSRIKKAYSAELFIYIIDKPHIDEIVSFISNFTPELLNNIKALFASKYGNIDTDFLNRKTMREFLLNYIPF